MELIDEDGRLFGVVNVIDALVVLLVLAVAVAGIALLQSSQETPKQPGQSNESTIPTVTQYATIDLGNVPSFVAAHIENGDELTTKNGGTVDVTDVYVGPGKGTQTRTLLRVKASGPLPDGQTWVTVGKSPLTFGRTLTLRGQS